MLTDATVVGFAGSVVPYEGLDLLLEALAELKHKRNVVFVFLLVGDGGGLDSIKAKAKELGT